MFKAKQKIGNGLEKRILILEERLLMDNDTTRAETISELEMLVEVRTRLVGGTDKLSKDAVLAAGVSLVTVLAILNYEKVDVVTSKAFNLLR